MPIYHAGQQCYDLRTEGEAIQMLLNEGRVVYLRDPDLSSDPRLPIVTKCRLVEEYGPNGWEKWWEFGIELPASLAPAMTGNSAAGWSIAGGTMLLHLEHSEDLTNWALGRLLPSPNTPESDGNPDPDAEILTHWSRCIYPQDSILKTGVMRSSQRGGDARMNPFLSVVIAGVVQDLPNYPYSMPEDAALLAADLVAIGWIGATCESSGVGRWDIMIPGVFYDQYSKGTYVQWPMFLVPNMYGDVVNECEFGQFAGDFVNTANVRTGVTKQFGRVGVRVPYATMEQAVNAWLYYFSTP